TATSMIGWIALAGIIVRNSILLIDATIQLVSKGSPLRDAVINATKARTRPIMITALALVLGSMVILTDPTFQGMAISLLFGVFVSTILTLLVIPLGCISLGERIFVCAGSKGPNACQDYDEKMANGNVSHDNEISVNHVSAESIDMTKVDFDVSNPVEGDKQESSTTTVTEQPEEKIVETEAKPKVVVKKKATVKKKPVTKKKSVRKKATRKKAVVKKGDSSSNPEDEDTKK
ncbi:MAG: efflux RND transporter permease subunit, partial [Gammaproteobacteria bacterium]|nr:efflux RND transporter permease subunit [Gammaproteobacteria bacterium]